METLKSIPLDAIAPSKTNPRKNFDAQYIDELAASIAQVGLMQPIIVRPNGGNYVIIAGECRYRAARKAGLEEISAIVRTDLSDAAILELQLVENLRRRDLHPMEEAQGYRSLLLTKQYDVARIAERVGRSVKYVYDRVKLLDLVPEAQELFLANTITAGHAILLARLSPADQKRAMKAESGGYGRPSGLFVMESTLFDPREEDDGKDPYKDFDKLKPVSVREFDAWIKEHVKFDRTKVDPMLFPETVTAFEEAAAEKRKVIPITYSYRAGDDIRKAGDERIYGERAWKRADGKMKSKTCDFAVLGVIVDGAGYGEAFKVCVNKDKCKVHWEAEKRAKQKSAKTAGASKKDYWARERERQEKERRRREAAEARYKKAMPAIRDAMVFAVKKAPTKATGLLAKTILGYMNVSVKKCPILLGTTSDDFVRHAAYLVLAEHFENPYHAAEHFAKIGKAFNVDVDKLVAAASPDAAGVCKKCGCTEATPCDHKGLPCAWTDETQTLCTACVPAKKTSKTAKKRRS